MNYLFKNIAFKCTYNDGGISQNGIGFLDVCSDSMIRQHIRDGVATGCNRTQDRHLRENRPLKKGIQTGGK